MVDARKLGAALDIDCGRRSGFLDPESSLVCTVTSALTTQLKTRLNRFLVHVPQAQQGLESCEL